MSSWKEQRGLLGTPRRSQSRLLAAGFVWLGALGALAWSPPRAPRRRSPTEDRRRGLLVGRLRWDRGGDQPERPELPTKPSNSQFLARQSIAHTRRRRHPQPQRSWRNPRLRNDFATTVPGPPRDPSTQRAPHRSGISVGPASNVPLWPHRPKNARLPWLLGLATLLHNDIRPENLRRNEQCAGPRHSLSRLFCS